MTRQNSVFWRTRRLCMAALMVIVFAPEAPVAAEDIEQWRQRKLAADGRFDLVGQIEANRAAGGRLVFVSSSDGDDRHAGTHPDAPKRTLAAATRLLRHEQPDVLLLKRGDVWKESFGHVPHSGRSPDLPRVIATYGGGPRPLVLTRGDQRGIFFQGSGGAPQTSNLVMHGLHLRAVERGEKDNPSGIFYLRGGSHIWMEDLAVEGYKDNIVLQTDGARPRNIILRRSLIADAWSSGAHAQGIYADNIHGLLIEDCLFDRNGYRSDDRSDATIYNHNIYIQHNCSDVIVRGNVVANASSHGIQLRPGGVIEANLFVGNPLAVAVGGTAASIVRGNVILDGGDIRPDLPRGYGIEVVHEYGQPASVLIEQNLIARHGSAQPFTYAILVRPDIAPAVTVRENVIWSWPKVQVPAGATVENNVIDSDGYANPQRTVGIDRAGWDTPSMIAHVREGFSIIPPKTDEQTLQRLDGVERRLSAIERRRFSITWEDEDPAED